ncbi:cytochrome P450 [Arthrobacter sp. MYb211]|uniref:cytochrome P450 n=1 Tax=unclassified Arthrobacter TaxID=235627 RepID=UPI000CFCE44B|nr:MULTISPECIES: cytochrome P450 [unclassified Arthrobacter]PRA10866.1 cytochrome P450 [Arthrobacter sp. MYb221]PRC06927.1 cytochrome P450 [Arthrobacter sp. MYb211]
MSTSTDAPASCPFSGAAAEASSISPAKARPSSETGAEAPSADWVTIADLHDDPFPIYQKLRAQAPIHWVPAVNRYMVTSYAAAHEIEQNEADFTANERESLMKRSMGHSMLRKDNPEHQIDRDSYGKTLRPATIKNHWNEIFAANNDKYLNELQAKGPGADFVWDYAAPYTAENLRLICGFHNASQQDMQRWSQSMIDGTGNYADDPAIWAKSAESSAEVDAAIAEMLPYLAKNPDHSLLSGLASMPIPLEAIRANLKMTIGGGLNEPRDVLATTVWALLNHPDQRHAVQNDDALYSKAFEESVRWVAPIGMYPRETTRDLVLEGIALPQGARLGVVLGAANRDPQVFDDPESFNIFRPKKAHLAFGGGVHFCAGTWIARAQVAQIALPTVFGRLPNLRLDPANASVDAGWVFRGMTKMPVLWDS